jgi:hypothetical protein
MIRSRLVAGAIVALALTQSACVTWRYETDPVPQVIQRSPARVWVPVGVDSFVILQGSRIVNDTLTGLIEGSAEPGFPLQRYAEPVASVTRVATEEANAGYGFRMALAVTSVLLTIGLAGVILGPVQ